MLQNSLKSPLASGTCLNKSLTCLSLQFFVMPNMKLKKSVYRHKIYRNSVISKSKKNDHFSSIHGSPKK